jgi:hypothetical protein
LESLGVIPARLATAIAKSETSDEDGDPLFIMMAPAALSNDQ